MQTSTIGLIKSLAAALFLAAMLMPIVTIAAAPSTQGDIAKSIAGLSSDEGATRAAATKAIFTAGKDAIAPLVQAGARQISPYGTIDTRRIDMVYSLLDGLRNPPAGNHPGYSPNAFGLRVEKGCTRDDVVKMGAKYGFTLPQEVDSEGKPVPDFNPDGAPTCYVRLELLSNVVDGG